LHGTVRINSSTVSPTYTNCIGYDPKFNGTPSPFDNDFPGRCVTIKDTIHQGTNKMIEMFAPNAGANGIGECAINSPCKFTIKLTSNGAETNKSVLFGAKLQSGVAEAMADGGGMTVPGWVCSATFAAEHRGTCASTEAKEMPPQTSLQAVFGVIAGKTWKKDDKLTLCATVEADSNPNDDDACATVKLDPFNVKVTKTGDQACTIGGDCNFNIKLFNPGPIDHNAPVTISDKLTGISSAQIVSITPPLPCATQPSQIPFSCTSPGPVRLDLDAPEGNEFGPRNYKMVVRLPRYYYAAKAFSNCADVSDGVTQASDQSCQSVSLVPPTPQVSIAKSALSASCSEATPCEFVVTLTNTGDEPVQGPVAFYDTMLTGNQQLSQVKLDGAPPAPWTCIGSAAPGMQCSHPGPLPPKTGVSMRFAMVPLPGSLGAATEVTNCAEYMGSQNVRSCVNVPVRPAAATPTGQCAGGMVLTNGICACPAGTKWNGMDCGTGGFNTSKPITPEPAPVVTTPSADCTNGLVKASSGLCVCPPNTLWNGTACKPKQLTPGTETGGFNTSKQPTPGNALTEDRRFRKTGGTARGRSPRSLSEPASRARAWQGCA